MQHDYLEALKKNHPAWCLLYAHHAPLIVSFLFQVFVKPNKRALPYSGLVSKLDDYLFDLGQIYGDDKYPRSAKQYLEEWCNKQTPFLRKYYTDLSDEPEVDLTPATEKAIEWIQSLEEKQFIGTESRLLTIFRLLKEIVDKTEPDPQSRINELQKQKDQIDTEISKLQNGIVEPYDATQIKERYYQVEETARRLLSDFRQVEYNFRSLDRQTREKITTSEKSKGSLLEDIFQQHDVIRNSDQGKSFRAFWQFIMSPARQTELHALLKTVHELEEIANLQQDPFLQRIRFYLLEAGEKVHKTSNLLVEQLRKYLDDQTFLENKRILDLIKQIEKHAVEIKDHPPVERAFSHITQFKPQIDLIMARGLFSVPKNSTIDEMTITQGKADIDTDRLYQQDYVDEAQLKANIRQALLGREQISLKQLTNQYPVQKGLAEIVTYLNIAAKDDKAIIDDKDNETLELKLADNKHKLIDLPKVIYLR